MDAESLQPVAEKEEKFFQRKPLTHSVVFFYAKVTKLLLHAMEQVPNEKESTN